MAAEMRTAFVIGQHLVHKEDDPRR